MRTPRSLSTLLIIASASLHGSCSAVVASHEIFQCAPFDVPADASGADAGAGTGRLVSCDVLNRRDGRDAASCERWTCDQATRFCVFRPRDADGDGVFAAYSATSGCSYSFGAGGPDCDDRDAGRRPGAEEACDGRDNDCDLLIDEDATRGVVSADMPTAPLDPGGASGVLIAFPSSRAGSARSALVSRRDAPAVASWLDLASPGMLTTARWRFDCDGAGLRDGCPASLSACTPLACELRTPTIDVAGGSVWAATTNTVGACAEGEIRLGERRGADLVIYNVGATQSAYPPCEPGAILGESRLAVSTSGARGLVATVRRGAESGSCPGGAASVQGQVVTLNPSNFIVPGPMADLGPTHGASSFALQSLAGEAWIAAIPGATSGIRVVRIDASGGVTQVGTVGSDSVAVVSLATGQDGSRVYVGLVFADACGAGPLRFASMSYDLSFPSTVSTTAPTELAPSGSAASLHWSDAPVAASGLVRSGVAVDGMSDSGWVVVWSDDHTRAQRILAADGAPAGDAVVLLDAPSAVLWTAPESGDRTTFVAAVDAAARLTTIHAFCAPTAP